MFEGRVWVLFSPLLISDTEKQELEVVRMPLEWVGEIAAFPAVLIKVLPSLQREHTCWFSGGNAVLWCGHHSRQKFQRPSLFFPLLDFEMKVILGIALRSTVRVACTP